MSKSQSKAKVGKGSQKSDVLTKVKDAAVTKPAQNLKSKSKDLAKQVTTVEKKKKKPAKEPTPEPSSSEEDSDSSVDSSENDSEDESEAEAKKPVAAGKGKVAAAAESSDESESDAEVPTAAAKKGAAPVADSDASSDASDDDEAEAQEESDSDDSASDSDNEEEKPTINGTNKGAKLSSTKNVDSEDSAEESDNASASSDDESGSDGDSEAEEVKPVNKRKAEEEDTPAAKKSKTELDTSRGSNLFVGSLSWNVDEGWLREEFEAFGELSGVRVMTDRQTGRSKGFGYVEFVNPADAAKAHAEKQGAVLDGRAMNVDFANARPSQGDKQENRRKSYNDQVSEPSETLFVGNLSFDVGQDAVSNAFADHGTILGVRLPTDRETGQPKGFGYVTFASVEEAQAAMEAMQGFYLENRPIRLDFSQPRPQNSDSPGRGGFGGGFGGRGRGGFGGRGGRGGGRGDFRGGRGGARGRGGNTTNRGGFSDFSGRKTTF